MRCELLDVLFAVFGLAICGPEIRLPAPESIQPIFKAPRGTDGRAPSVKGYMLKLPRRVWTMPTGNTPGRESGAAVSSTTSVAFFFTPCPNEGDAPPSSGSTPAFNRLSYSGYDLVTEVTESDHHLLIECFFKPGNVPPATVARLLFRYAEGLREAEFSMLTPLQ